MILKCEENAALCRRAAQLHERLGGGRLDCERLDCERLGGAAARRRILRGMGARSLKAILDSRRGTILFLGAVTVAADAARLMSGEQSGFSVLHAALSLLYLGAWALVLRADARVEETDGGQNASVTLVSVFVGMLLLLLIFSKLFGGAMGDAVLALSLPVALTITLPLSGIVHPLLAVLGWKDSGLVTGLFLLAISVLHFLLYSRNLKKSAGKAREETNPAEKSE